MTARPKTDQGPLKSKWISMVDGCWVQGCGHLTTIRFGILVPFIARRRLVRYWELWLWGWGLQVEMMDATGSGDMGWWVESVTWLAIFDFQFIFL